MGGWDQSQVLWYRHRCRHVCISKCRRHTLRHVPHIGKESSLLRPVQRPTRQRLTYITKMLPEIKKMQGDLVVGPKSLRSVKAFGTAGSPLSSFTKLLYESRSSVRLVFSVVAAEKKNHYPTKKHYPEKQAVQRAIGQQKSHWPLGAEGPLAIGCRRAIAFGCRRAIGQWAVVAQRPIPDATPPAERRNLFFFR